MGEILPLKAQFSHPVHSVRQSPPHIPGHPVSSRMGEMSSTSHRNRADKLLLRLLGCERRAWEKEESTLGYRKKGEGDMPPKRMTKKSTPLVFSWSSSCNLLSACDITQPLQIKGITYSPNGPLDPKVHASEITLLGST